MRPRSRAGRRQAPPAPRSTGGDGRQGCDGAGLPAADKAPPSARAFRRKMWRGRSAGARSCRAFYLICGRGGTLPAPPQEFGLAEDRKRFAEDKSVTVRVDMVGRRIIKQKTQN